MKILLAIIALFPCFSYAIDKQILLPKEKCETHAPYGFPVADSVTEICRTAYFVGFDTKNKVPKYVTYELTKEHLIQRVTRSNSFAKDQSMRESALPKDYAKSGFDKGHMSPSGDMKWDQQVEHESFLMTNISPQVPSFNRGIWKLLETSIRNYVATSGHKVIVYVGSIYNTQDKKIGQGVIIPHSFYKIVINKATNTCFSWKFPHISPYTSLGNNLNKYKSSIKEIETESGVDFKIPEKCDETAKW